LIPKFPYQPLRINLYHDLYTEEQFLNTPIETLKERLKLTEVKNGFKLTLLDYFSFIGLLIIGLFYSVATILLIPYLIVYNIIQFLKPNQ